VEIWDRVVESFLTIRPQSGNSDDDDDDDDDDDSNNPMGRVLLEKLLDS
jgi:hypothetical protein